MDAETHVLGPHSMQEEVRNFKHVLGKKIRQLSHPFSSEASISSFVHCYFVAILVHQPGLSCQGRSSRRRGLVSEPVIIQKTVDSCLSHLLVLTT